MYLKKGRKTFFRLFLPDSKKFLDDLLYCCSSNAIEKQQNMKMYPQINTFLWLTVPSLNQIFIFEQFFLCQKVNSVDSQKITTTALDFN